MKLQTKIIAGTLAIAAVVLTIGIAETNAARKLFRGENKVEHVSELTGLSTTDVQTQLDNGSSVREILENEGVTKEDVQTYAVAQMEERLTQAVADGRLTQEEADEIRAKRAQRQATKEAVKAAIEANDYDAFVVATADSPRAGEISEDQFNTLVQAHALREAGDHEAAKELLQDAGIKRPGKGHKGFGPRGPQN